MSSYVQNIWTQLQAQLIEIDRQEPLVNCLISRYVAGSMEFGEALTAMLNERLNVSWISELALSTTLASAYASEPELVVTAALDLNAALNQEMANTQMIIPFLFSKGFHALQIYRVANYYWRSQRKLTALALSSACCAALGVDIHPAAKIGRAVVFDQAGGIVIGDAVEVGDDVILCNGVTIGALDRKNKNCQTKLPSGVYVGSHTIILGDIQIEKNTVINAGEIIVNGTRTKSIAAGVVSAKMAPGLVASNLDLGTAKIIEYYL